MKLTDSEIIENIKKRDSETLYVLKQKYKYMIDHLVFRYRYSDGINIIKGQKTDAEDILYDALYILIKKVSQDNFVLSAKLSSYFYSIGKNLLKQTLKKRLTEQKFIRENKDFEYRQKRTDSLYDSHLRKNILDYYFNKLSEKCKKILNLYWLELSVTEISEQLGNTKNYIMKRKYECQKKLIKLIKENPDNY